ncbi:MAG: hypothetical protein AAF456_01410 [Planctomycetota bacterium]
MNYVNLIANFSGESILNAGSTGAGSAPAGGFSPDCLLFGATWGWATGFTLISLTVILVTVFAAFLISKRVDKTSAENDAMKFAENELPRLYSAMKAVEKQLDTSKRQLAMLKDELDNRGLYELIDSRYNGPVKRIVRDMLSDVRLLTLFERRFPNFNPELRKFGIFLNNNHRKPVVSPDFDADEPGQRWKLTIDGRVYEDRELIGWVFRTYKLYFELKRLRQSVKSIYLRYVKLNIRFHQPHANPKEKPYLLTKFQHRFQKIVEAADEDAEQARTLLASIHKS